MDTDKTTNEIQISSLERIAVPQEEKMIMLSHHYQKQKQQQQQQQDNENSNSNSEENNDDECRTIRFKNSDNTNDDDDHRHHRHSSVPVNPLLSITKHHKRRATTTSVASASQSVESSTLSGVNVVTGSQTTATSSSGTPTTTSDDRDSSGANNGENSTGRDTSSGRDDSGSNSNSRGSPSNFPQYLRHHHQHHHHHHQHHNSNSNNYQMQRSSPGDGDGSDLQLPGNDGSERLASEGILQPATVVASRYTATYSSSTNSSSGGEGDSYHDHLLPPHREPGYHTIRRTFNQFPNRRKRGEDAKTKRRALMKNSSSTATDSSSSMEETAEIVGGTTTPTTQMIKTNNHKRKRIATYTRKRDSSSPSPDTSVREGRGGGSSSGSGTEGTEGGYAGSASSNEMVPGRQSESCSSPSVSSSEDFQTGRRRKNKRLRLNSKHGHQNDDASSSSDIADFSSGSSETADDDGVRREFDFKNYPSSPSPQLSSSNDDVSDDLEQSYLSAKRAADRDHERMLQAITRKRKAPSASDAMKKPAAAPTTTTKRLSVTVKNVDGRPPILTVGSDIMAHVLTFLQPPEILEVLTMPLSKAWRKNFTEQPELWRVLCLVEPFKANMDGDSSTSDDDRSSTTSSNDEEDDGSSTSGDSFCSLRTNNEDNERHQIDKFRHLYTSFVRCMKYLSQIRDDAINGRPPAYIDYGVSGGITSTSIDDKKAASNGVASC